MVSTLNKKSQIREGKRPVEPDVAVAPTPTAEKSTHQPDEEENPIELDDTEAEDRPKKLTAAEAKARWKEFRKIPCYGERRIDEVSFSEFNLINFLRSRGLLLSMTAVFPYSIRIVQLFYHSLPRSYGNTRSNNYGKVVVKNKQFEVSPESINVALGLPNVDDEEIHNLDAVAKEITGGKVTKWKKQLSASNLTFKYSVLHKILTYNWIVTTNTTVVTQSHGQLLFNIGLNKPFNLGRIMFAQIHAAAKESHLGGFPFPSLIYRMLCAQGLEAEAKSSHLEPILTYAINNQLFSAGKIQDLPWIDPSTPTYTEDTTTADSMVSISSSKLQSLLQTVSELKVKSQQIYQDNLTSLTGIEAELQELLYSQIGGDDDGDAAVASGDGTGAEGAGDKAS